uniref:Ig-like domain-containing protein n=1 Tax=Rhinolophus ferrumequinum TaxID=59479 RepID=A0A671ERB4_RHIFE
MKLTCSVPWACERGTPPIFSWTSAALASLGPRTLLSSMITLTPRPQDHGTNLTCQVKFPAVDVTMERTIQLNVTCESWARKPGRVCPQMPSPLPGSDQCPLAALSLGQTSFFSVTMWYSPASMDFSCVCIY